MATYHQTADVVEDKGHRLRVALVGCYRPVVVNWITSLRKEPTCVVKALWSLNPTDAANINREYFGGVMPEFSGFDTATGGNKGKGKKKAPINKNLRTLEALVRSDDIDGCFVCAPTELHADVVARILNVSSKHILSATIPVRRVSDFVPLLRLQPQHGGCGVWSVGQTLRYESAVNKVRSQLGDIGRVASGILNASVLPECQASPWSRGCPEAADRMLDVCVTYAGLLRRVFGNPKSVNCMASNTGDSATESVCGTVKFETEATVSVNLSSDAESPRLELVVLGTTGTITLAWDNPKEVFEVLRNLKHFEHPSLHLATGQLWTLAAWTDAACTGRFDHNTPYNSLLDLTVAEAMLNSRGTLVGFKREATPPASHDIANLLTQCMHEPQ